jgi:hypothetical protein
MLGRLKDDCLVLPFGQDLSADKATAQAVERTCGLPTAASLSRAAMAVIERQISVVYKLFEVALLSPR